MALFGADKSEGGDLNIKYAALEKDYKVLQQEQRDTDIELRDALMHLTKTALGVNSELDFQLKRLEVQLKDRLESKQLQTTSEIIHDLKKQSNSQFGAELKVILKQLIDYAYQLPNADTIQKSVADIERQASVASNLELPQLLQSLTGIIKRTIEVRVEKKKEPSILSKLFGGKQKDDLHLEPILTVLSFILNHITVPPNLDNEFQAIRNLVNLKPKEQSDESPDEIAGELLEDTADVPQDDVLQALDLTSQLVIKVHRNNERQFNRFIEEVNSQLGMMEELLFKQEQSNIIQQEENVQFDTTIAENFNEIKHDIEESDNLESLRTNMTGSLGTMMDKVKSYSNKQAKRAQENEQEIKRLNEKVRETELVTVQLVEELTKTSMEALSDALTGLPNRAAYDKRIEEEFARWERFKQPLVVIVCDIDHFKQVNDTFGHKAGDKVIASLGKTLKDALRKVDFIGRYGGEEFVILLEKTSLSSAVDVANKLREKIASLGFHFSDKPVKITMSFGVTQFQEGDTPDAAFERADQALYKSKEGGRNQVNSA